MSIHGWGSTGDWHNDFSLAAEELGFIPIPFNYGFTLRFDTFKVNSLINKFRTWYFEIVNDSKYELNINEPYYRPSIVAHSLGSWIIARAIEKYSDIKFDKIFLYGSIIPYSFDWYSLILRGQVHLIITETSKKDQFVRFGALITGKQLSCCRNGFKQQSRFIKYEDASKFYHSDFQYKNRFVSQLKNHFASVPPQLRIFHGRELTVTELKKYFKTTGQIDSDIYGEDYNQNPIILETALKWAEIEHDIWSFLVNSYSGEVIGYINVLPVTSDTFNSFIQGDLHETNIHPESILSFDDAYNFDVIIMSIAIKKSITETVGSVMTTQQGEILQMALAQKLVDKTKPKKKLRRVASIAWTASGLRLSERFGLERSNVNYSGHSVFLGEIDKMKNSSKRVGIIAKWFIDKVNT